MNVLIKLVLFLAVFLQSFVYADDRSLDSIYTEYLKVVTEDASAFDLHQTLNSTGLKGTLIGAIRGSNLTLMGRDAWLPWNKLSYVEKGMDKLEQSVESLDEADMRKLFRGSPVAVHVKVMATSTYLSLPEFFGGKPLGQHWLKELTQLDWQKYSPDLRASFYKINIQHAHEEGNHVEANRWLSKLLQLSPRTDFIYKQIEGLKTVLGEGGHYDFD